MVLDPIPQSLPVLCFGSRPQPPTSHHWFEEMRQWNYAFQCRHVSRCIIPDADVSSVTGNRATLEIRIRNYHWKHGDTGVMSHMNESCHIWMSHVTYEWVMSHMNESCDTGNMATLEIRIICVRVGFSLSILVLKHLSDTRNMHSKKKKYAFNMPHGKHASFETHQ